MTPLFADVTSINLIAIAADIYALYIAVVVAWALPIHWRFMNFGPTSIYHRPPRILGRFALPALRPGTVIFCQLVLIAALLSSIITGGLLHHICLLVALATYFCVYSAVAGLETNARKTYLIPLFILVFIAAPNTGGTWAEQNVYWPIWALKLFICQIYVSAAFQKLKNHGTGWVNQSSFGIYLLRLDLFEDNARARQIGARPSIYKPLSLATLCLQSTFWIILIVPLATPFYMAAGFIFHCGILYLMRINYLKYLGGAYLVLLLDSVYILGLIP